jgi:tetratricopeptide (TPR) repeat protein
MGRDDWFRNTAWDDAIAAAFEAKLWRARSKEQYLRIQAGTLADARPDIAHALLDRYFGLPDQFDAAQAYVDRARAYLAQSRLEEALIAYESALAREEEHPNLLTVAYIELPYLVATRTVEKRYSQARELLAKHKHRLMFPVDHFKWNAAQALIARALGQADSPYQHAKAALEAAERDHSGFRYHAGVGLVGDSLSEVRDRLRRLCDA